MSIYNSHAAHDRAIDIVKVALQSGALKLNGPTIKSNPDEDAAYVSGLINAIARDLTAK
ncbi:hypothetical protein GM658_12495 [Pseudoduganella eburnea]|uniref:Uncharacterized protein n=1 Tax=Massilia eburnea TaxID=1776165 RepID=A0A6L6QIF1_9BURK|nr:hypothetical protein [Massilia eburnea]MTW11416.1 hypothetical protein [Massilia eburnea]